MRFSLKDLLFVFFPDRCVVCESILNRGEELLCLTCMHEMPFTGFADEPENEMERVFSGRCRIRAATALLYFEKGNTSQHLIHKLKYRGMQQIGAFLGNLLADSIITSERFAGIQAIVPVPLHPEKLKKRGYNQLTKVGQSLSEKLQVPFYEDVLVRKGPSVSQTHKNRFERMAVISDAFEVWNSDKIKGKYILLVDDVLTTGATLEACCNVLSQVDDLQIGLATLAYTPPKLL